MADSSLDDFFAKKDKSKKKGKSKTTPGELMEKQKVKKKKATSDKSKDENQQQLETNSTKPLNDDDEWLEVQEEEKDYTGLRIQTLQIAQEREESEKESEDKGSDGEEEEGGEKKDNTAAGPWTKIEAPPAPIKPPEPEPVVEPKKEDTPAKPAKYVPPGARQAAAQSQTQSRSIGPGMGPMGRRRVGKTAPNLKSEEDFPTLGGDGPVVDSAWGAGNFEKVKSGGKQMDDPASKGLKLSLDNKFTALQGETD